MSEPENGEPTRPAPPAGAHERRTAPPPHPDGDVPDSPGTGIAAATPPKPRIGDTRPAPPRRPAPAPTPFGAGPGPVPPASAPRPGPLVGAPVPAGGGGSVPGPPPHLPAANGRRAAAEEPGPGARRSRGRRRGGRDRKGRSTGRYLVCVHVAPQATQIAVLEGRSLVEHYVSRPADETSQIDGNIYRGRVQNVLPGMEAAFVDIGIPKNAVLYRGDVRYDRDDVEGGSEGSQPRIEEVLRPGQTILCQVTKNPIGAKGARLTQEVSLPGRFAVLVPDSSAFGISKRLGDNERRRLRRIVDDVRPPGHGLIIRTAAEGASADELRRDVEALVRQWEAIAAAAGRSDAPGLLYREPDLAVRLLREELTSEYRAVIIDDADLYEQVRSYVATVSPDLVDRVELYDTTVEPLPIFERFHVHEQLHKALDRKVWLPSGGSLIIEGTEALTVIDVNTGKNVGTTNLEETVFRNNLEAAEEVARQLRLRDIGGIIVIDFIDMEVRENREKVAAALRAALARDKTRTQVFDISELGLVEMTRKRVSEGLIESLSTTCEVCNGRGIVLDRSLLG
ncbi:MAG TPA: Rne/Rng family ribonuclease [Acidimicrobiales bacterium]|nr:Rne/Rng family ribonuclease [Acidimicrobiales bacterium]